MTAQIVTANRLGDGAVIYLGRDNTWGEGLGAAAVARSRDEAAALLVRAEAPDHRTSVVGPYLMDVIDEAAAPRPASNRENIRALGPTVRSDLGRQAETLARG